MLMLAGLQASTLFASPVAILREGVNRYALGRYLDVLEDKNGELTIEEITSPEVAGRFVANQKEILNFGFTEAAYWVVFHLKNKLDTPRRYLLEVGFPLIDKVDLYIPATSGEYTIKKAGELIPVQQREIRYHKPVFSLTVRPGREQTFYIRYQDNGSVAFPLTLWTPESFARKIAKERFLLGVYYGAMLIMLLYNMIIYLTVGGRSYPYYVLYILCYIVWQMSYNGLAGEFLWPDLPWLTNQAIPFLISGSIFFAIQFTKIFLNTRKNTPRLHKLLSILMVGFVLVMAISLQPDYAVSVLLSTILAAFFAVVAIITSFICWRNGYRPARYFFIAWFALLLGTAVLSLKSLGFLPSNSFTEYALQVGSLLEIILLSLALADQVNIMKHEKERAQTKALRIQQTAREQLEIQVRERTRSLRESNRKLKSLSAKLAKYLSPQIYNSIFSGKTEVKLQSRRKCLTIFFSDIKDFTELTDNMEPEALTAFLNAYLNEMSAITVRYGGTIDKFIGDAIMIFFGDPETRGKNGDALACVLMAIEMRDRLKELRKKWQETAVFKPVQIRMGINTGYCTVGNLGTEDRLDYTIIGGPVNLASRLETLAEPDQIFISAATHALIKDKIACTAKGSLTVKGIASPVQVHQVTGRYEDTDITKPAVIKEEGEGYSILLDLEKMSAAAKERLAAALKNHLPV